jgi:hypothetical protein
MSHAHDDPHPALDIETVRTLQSRVNAILSGTASSGRDTRPAEEMPLIATFVPSHQHRASALAAFWMKIADEGGGARGLGRAIDYMYEGLASNYPIGMVKYAAELFLTHYAPARAYLAIPSLEQIQPGAVRPSNFLTDAS